MHPSLQELQRAYSSGDLVIFAGAGISAGAGLPSWPELTERLIEHAAARGESPDSLDEVRELAGARKFIDALSALKDLLGGPEFCAFVEHQLDDARLQIPPAAEAISSLAEKLHAVLTTNVDRILERTLAGRWPTFSRPTSDIAQRRGFLLKLHGTLHERETWVFTRVDYDRAMYADPQMKGAFSALFHGRTLLFLGYGLADDDFDQLLSRVRALAGDQPPRHFAIVPNGGIGGYRRKLLESSGVSLITYANQDGSHGELPRLIRAVAQGSSLITPLAQTSPRSLVSLKISGISARAQTIVDERPLHWENRLFSQVLTDELAASAGERRDMELGITFGLVERQAPHETMRWMGSQFHGISQITEGLANLVNVGLVDAMGPPGQPGDPEKLVYVANRIGQTYRETIAWSMRWRRLHAEAMFDKLRELGQDAGGRLVHQLENWSRRIELAIRDILDAEIPLAPGTAVSLSVTIDLPPNWQENVSAELRKLRPYFGMPDDE